jgi:adenylate cyclase
MAIEIERKYLVHGEPWRGWGEGVLYRQGYLSRGAHSTTRVRLAGAVGQLTLKGKTEGISRLEFEYEIPAADAEALLALCEGGLILKRRWRVPVGDHIWEVDVFEGENAGLVVAEIELSSPDETFERPSWIGEEVSHDPRYSNGALSRRPWRQWGDRAN